MMENKNNLKAFMSDLQTGISAAIVVAKVCCQFHCTWQKKETWTKTTRETTKKKAKHDSPFLPPLRSLADLQTFFFTFFPRCATLETCFLSLGA